MKGMDRLLELQGLDTSLDHLQARKKILEAGEEVKEATARFEEAERELGDLRLALDAVGREQRRLELELDSMTQKAEAENKRMYDGSVTNPKELEALQAEIRNLKERKSRVEDDLLEQMEQREDLDGRITGAEKSVEDARGALESVGGASAKALSEIEEQLSNQTVERSVVAGEIDEELLELYGDIRRQKRGLGAAALVDGVCQGCHEKLSALEMDKLKKTEGVKRCEYCRRILIFA